MTLIDTAELYGDGASEILIAEALGKKRREAFIVSKVVPHHANVRGTKEACENSLKRLKTDYIDLYLLHWMSSIPFEETLEAFQSLKKEGKILDYGVSNYDLDELQDALKMEGGEQIATDQVYYNLTHRGIEWDLLPWCQKKGIPIMAYSPFDQGRLSDHSGLDDIAKQHDKTPSQIALAWSLRHKGIVSIPKAGNPNHIRENYEALEIELTEEDLEALNKAFPPPSEKIPLQTI